MRVIKQIQHPDCLISVFYWNGKYLLKYEVGHLEQTYKINELDIASEEDVFTLAQMPTFVEKIIATFKQMHGDLREEAKDVLL